MHIIRTYGFCILFRCRFNQFLDVPIQTSITNNSRLPYIKHVLYYQFNLQKDINQWHIVFYITAVVYFVTNLFFVIFGQAEIQAWNDVGDKYKKRSDRLSIISTNVEPIMLSIPEQIKEEECRSPC